MTGGEQRHAYLHELTSEDGFSSTLRSDLGKYRLPEETA